jgi:CRISPR-associated protein Csm1
MQEQNLSVINAALAGLLHDIGKFSQRAGEGLTETWDKQAEADYGYQHALASHGFVRKFVPDSWREELSGIAYHHRPQTQRDYWIQLADWLSSAEREADEDNRVPRMQSIFSNLSSHNQPHYLPLKRLDPTDQNSLFPQPLADDSWKTDSQKAYEALWIEFEAECQSRQLAQISDRWFYLETIFALLQDFCWSVPSAYWNNVPDVSLFDHLRTTAAIAACLAADNHSIQWCKDAKQDNAEVGYLVGGDLSGLQAFIYTLASSGAAKSLRARSFYVQLISEALALAILDELGLPTTNLIYVGGGGFQLLAPLAAKDRLPDIVRDLADRLLTVHQGGLGLTVKWETVKYAEFGEFNKVRARLGQSINRAKRQPFASASLETLRAAIGQPLTEGGNPDKFCRVTGEDGDAVRPDKEGVYKSDFVLDLEGLGQQLPKATHIAFARTQKTPPARATRWQQALRAFGMEAQIVIEGKNVEAKPLQKGDFVRVWRLEDPRPKPDEAQRLALLGPAQVIGYRPFAKLTPTNDDGNPLTFDDLAKPMRGSFQRWGVLRMDVDNLGWLFRDGLKNASLSRVASLSFALQLFFEGWLPKLAGDDLKDYLYIQYSGGDDLFVVGAWDALPLFAQRIRQSFGEYVVGNPAVTVSGGMTMAEAGFPLYQAAEQAGEAEDAAKTRRTNGKEKDAFTFMGETMGWKEFAEVEKLAYEIADAIAAKQMPRALPQTLLALHGQVKRAQKPGQSKPQFGRWTWMAAYQLTRMVIQTKDEGAKQQIKKLQDKFLTGNMEALESIGLAARWAQYLTRGG